MDVDLETRKGAAAIEVAEALLATRKASASWHDRDKPDTSDASCRPTPMGQQHLFAAFDRLDAAVDAYTAVR